MKTSRIAQPGEFVALPHDTGCQGYVDIYGKVIRTSSLFYYVLFEWSEKPRRIMHHKVDNVERAEYAEDTWKKNVNKQAEAKWCSGLH